jgi:hypothetical protein
LQQLLRIAKRPTRAQAQARAVFATQDFMKLYGRS